MPAFFPIVNIDRYRPIVATLATADPAANTEISQTVPSNQFWQLIGARVSLVTDATVSNRTVQLTLDDGTTVWNLYPSPSTQAASLTYNYNFAVGAQNTTVLNNNVVVSLGSQLILPAGYRIRTLTNNLQATDNYGVMTLMLIKYVR